MMELQVKDILKTLPKRRADSHKGDFGHVFVIAGSMYYTGAPYLTSQAALLSGSGLVTLGVGKSLHLIMAAKLIEVMVRPFFETRDYSLSLLAEKDLLAFSAKCDVVIIGPGISQNRETQALVRNIVSKLEKPVVLDADGINAFAGHADILKNHKGGIVLTPHAGEMARLIGKDINEITSMRKEIALEFANEYNTVLVLKGHNTIVANPGGDYYINTTGNPGMATGGMGDILTGMIASFVGQGLDLFSAAIVGVYLHGMAGDIALKDRGVLSLIASDLLNKLPEALKTLG